MAEHSICVDKDCRGQVIGTTLLLGLVRRAERRGFRKIRSSTFPENKANIVIHLFCGFRVLRRRKRVARLHGVWLDTVLVERGSAAAGID